MSTSPLFQFSSEHPLSNENKTTAGVLILIIKGGIVFNSIIKASIEQTTIYWHTKIFLGLHW